MAENTQWTIRSRIEFCDQLFIDCIDYSPRKDIRERFVLLHQQLQDWATLLNVFRERFEPSLDKWLKGNSRLTLRESLEVVLIGLAEHLMYVVKPFYLRDQPRLSPANMEAAQDGITTILATLDQFAINVDELDTQLEIQIAQDILKYFPLVLPPETSTSPTARWRDDATGIYKADPEYLRRVTEEVRGDSGPLHQHLVILTLFRHYRMLYEHQLKLDQLRALSTGPPSFLLHFHQQNRHYDHGYRDPIVLLSPEFVVSGIIQDENSLYPKPPVIDSGQKTAVCPVCLEACPVEVFQGEKWTAHVDRDIKPYACLFSICVQDNEAFFSDVNEWKQHMHRYHSLTWIADIHRNFLWNCPICSFASPRELGSKEMMMETLLIHMEVSHSIGQDDERRLWAGFSYVLATRPLDKCPICTTCHPGLPEPPQSAEKRFMKLREVLSNDDGAPEEYMWEEEEDGDNPATKAAEDCIAGHLKYIALQCFKYFVAATKRQRFPRRETPAAALGLKAPWNTGGKWFCLLIDAEFVRLQEQLLLLDKNVEKVPYRFARGVD